MTFRSFRRSLFGWGLFLLGCLSLSPNAFAAGAAEPVTVTLTAEEERLLRELLVRIEDKDLAKRVGAANAIGGLANGRTVPPRGSVGKASPRTIAALAKGLQDPEASMRMASAYALRRGAAAHQVAPSRQGCAGTLRGGGCLGTDRTA